MIISYYKCINSFRFNKTKECLLILGVFEGTSDEINCFHFTESFGCCRWLTILKECMNWYCSCSFGEMYSMLIGISLSIIMKCEILRNIQIECSNWVFMFGCYFDIWCPVICSWVSIVNYDILVLSHCLFSHFEALLLSFKCISIHSQIILQMVLHKCAFTCPWTAHQ